MCLLFFLNDNQPLCISLDRLFPFGQMPTLEVDGTVIAQTMAIARYLADEFGKLLLSEALLVSLICMRPV